MIRRFLPKSHRLKHICQFYVDTVVNENCTDMRINGELNLMNKLLPYCKIVFDVGANCGQFTKKCTFINPSSHFFCFEPEPTIYNRLRQTIKPLGKQINIFNMAIGKKSENRTLFSFGSSSGLGSLYYRQGIPEEKQQTQVKVSATSLDKFCQEKNISNIDYLKIDVEGSEVEVLQGATGLLGEGKITFIHLEYGSGYIGNRFLLRDIFDIAKKYKYDLYQIGAKGLVYYPNYEVKLENFRTKYFCLVSPLTGGKKLQSLREYII